MALSDDRDRRTVLRLILRQQRQDDFDAGRQSQRTPIVVKADREPRVTAAGGKKLYRRFELLTGGATSSSASRVASDGLYSLVVRVKARGFGGSGKTRWRRNEGANLVRYFTRADALEREPGLCILSSLVDDEGKDVTGRVLEPGTDEWAREHFALWQAIEKLEADAAKVKPGKSKTKVNVYRHVIIPLPHELDADERLELVRQITAVFRARGLPHVAAIHRPDPGGDQRNFHVHIIVSARPSIPVGAYEWQFEALKDPEVFTPEYLLAFRIHVAEQFNHALAKAGSDRVYTHVSREDRNVDVVAEVHEGRSKTNAQRRADHVVEVPRQLDVKREQRAQLAALAHLGRELARVVRSSGDLAGYVWAEACESVRMARQLLANPTDLSIETAQVILHSTVNGVADAAAPLFTVIEEAAVRRLPVATPPPEIVTEMEVKAVERPATPLMSAAPPIAVSFEPPTMPKAAPATILPVKDGLVLTPIHQEFAVTRSTANSITEPAPPLFEVIDEAPVRRLPVSAPSPEATIEVQVKAVERTATPLGPAVAPVAASFEPITVHQDAPGEITPVQQEPKLKPIERAYAILHEMQFDAAERVPITMLIAAMVDGRLAITPQLRAVATVESSTDDLSAARSAAVVAETDRGRAFMARLATEVAPLLPKRDAQSVSFVLEVRPEGASWRVPLAGRVLPVVFRKWDTADRHLRAHLNLLLRAMVHPKQYFCAGLGRGLWWYSTGNEQLEAAVKALQRDAMGQGILQALAGVSETSLGSLRPDFPVWRSDQPNQAPRSMAAEVLRAQGGQVEPPAANRVAERSAASAAVPAPDPFAEARNRFAAALTGPTPRAKILSVNGATEVLVRDADLVADLKLLSRRADGIAFFRQRAREAPEVPNDNGWIRHRVVEAPDAGAEHADMLRWLQQQRDGPGR